jgi:hypothetical protein
MCTAALEACATRYRFVGSRHTPATRITLSFPAIVAPDAMYAPCVPDVADVLTLYVYDVLDVLAITIDDTTVYVDAVAPLSHTLVALVAVVVPRRFGNSAMSASHQHE